MTGVQTCALPIWVKVEPSQNVDRFVWLFDSAVEGNESPADGGGLWVSSAIDELLVVNSRIAANTALQGGGVYGEGADLLFVHADLGDGDDDNAPSDLWQLDPDEPDGNLSSLALGADACFGWTP